MKPKKPAAPQSSPLPLRMRLMKCVDGSYTSAIHNRTGRVVAYIDDRILAALIVRRINEGPKRDAAFAAMRLALSGALSDMRHEGSVSKEVGDAMRAALQLVEETK